MAKDYEQRLGGISMVHGVNIRSLRKIWLGLKLPGVAPSDKTEIGAKIHEFVKDTCGCLYLT